MRAGVRDGKFPRQHGDQLHMRAQLEVEIEQKEQTDHDPDIDKEVDTAADADEFCKAGRGRRWRLLAPRRVIARRPLWVSVTRNPVVRRVNKVAASSNMRRESGWLTEVARKRLPRAKSAPCLANASSSTAMSGAECCPSAS